MIALTDIVTLVLLYFLVGFGPGFIIGLLLGNRHGAGQPSFLDTHEENIRKAAEHNAQWDPTHERWQK